MNKSITKNLILNMIKTAMSIIFPMITLSYASRVLGVKGIGKVSYGDSIVSYFVLIAALGISTYGIREVAKVKENQEKMNQLVIELLTINVVTCIITYVIFGIVLQVPMFSAYKKLLIIQSVTILLNTIGVEWLFSALEEYVYITIRSILFQIIAIILMILFVKNTEDYCKYAAICVFAASGSQILNLWYSRKFVNIGIKNIKNIKVHLKPILIIFGTNVASVIYMSLDTTMIGIIRDVGEVGLYSAAVKIVKIISTLLASISTVMLPRLSYYIENKKNKEYELLLEDSSNYTMMISIPCAIGLIIVSKDVIRVFSGTKFEEAYIALSILAFNQIFSSIDRILAWQVLMPIRKEKIVFFSTIIGAVSNFLLNLVIIKLLGYNGAAITTFISELIVFLVLVVVCRKKVNIIRIFKYTWQYILGTFVIIIVGILVNENVDGVIIRLFLNVTFSVTGYMLVLMLLRNKYLYEILASVKRFGRRING